MQKSVAHFQDGTALALVLLSLIHPMPIPCCYKQVVS